MNTQPHTLPSLPQERAAVIVEPRPAPAGRGWLATIVRRVLGAALLLSLVACASLPGGVQRPLSVASGDVAGTRLARIAAAAATSAGLSANASAPAAGSASAAAPADAAARSGFTLLPSGDQALGARLALARRAEKTLDVQYYLIASDRAGLRFLGELADAAARGVRVRVLIDDLYAAGQDRLLAGLAAHPNVELRLFNPLPVRDGGFGARVALSLHEFSRINRRMHNKLFVADNSFAVTGGRNVADEYFGLGGPANFIDMDILSSGPVVRELSAVFDGFWNNHHAFPVQSLVGAGFDSAAARAEFDAAVEAARAAPAPFAADVIGAQLDSGALAPTFATARVLADTPDKIDGAAEEAGADGPVTAGNLALLRSARSEVLVASPYFVPGETGLAALNDASARGVRLTVMTNSLATTDEPLVHFGYARYRNAMLAMGVRLFELMPTGPAADASTDRAQASPAPAAGDGGLGHGSLGRLHAKLAVVDQRFLFIGSMNMDRRSARCNTEAGLVIDSPELSAQVADLLKRERLPGSYRLRLAQGGDGIEWVAGRDTTEVVKVTEPDAGAAQHLSLSLLSLFISEALL